MYSLDNWQISLSRKRRRSAGPFLMIFRSSGEKNTIFTMPKSSDALRIGTPSMAIPLDLFFLDAYRFYACCRSAPPSSGYGLPPGQTGWFRGPCCHGAILSYPRDIKPREYSSFPGHCRRREYSFRGWYLCINSHNSDSSSVLKIWYTWALVREKSA